MITISFLFFGQALLATSMCDRFLDLPDMEEMNEGVELFLRGNDPFLSREEIIEKKIKAVRIINLCMERMPEETRRCEMLCIWRDWNCIDLLETYKGQCDSKYEQCRQTCISLE